MFDFFSQLLEDVPETAFFNAVRPFSTTANRQRVFERLFQPTQNRFFGELGGQAARGQMPDLTWQRFLGGQDWNRLFFDQPRWDRGAHANFFNPRTRFMVGF